MFGIKKPTTNITETSENLNVTTFVCALLASYVAIIQGNHCVSLNTARLLYTSANDLWNECTISSNERHIWLCLPNKSLTT